MTTARIPVTILGGFLGAGKTTLLRRRLADRDHAGTAVIVNEFGEAGLDDRLVRVVAEQPVLLAGGCVCCGQRPDLVRALGTLLDERDRGHRQVDRIVIECSGLADPAPVAFTITTDPMLRHHFAVTRTVVAVDAVNGPAQLTERPECRKQALVADELIITKGDLAGEHAVRALAATLHELNPSATVRASIDGQLDHEPLALPDADGNAPASTPALADAGAATHSDGVRSLTIAREQPLDWVAFSVWLSMLLHARGEDVLRVKGVLGTGPDQAVSVNGVQHVIHPPEHVAADAAAGPGRTRLVVIARDIDPATIERSFDTFQHLARPQEAVAA